MQNLPVFTFKIGGEAGHGIMSAGTTFSKIATRSGYYTFDYTEYPSLVRGGHNVMQVSVSKEPVYSQYSNTEFLVALNQETLNLHKDELHEDSRVMFDPDEKIDPSDLPDYIHKVPVPLREIAVEVGKTIIMRNTVALGAITAFMGGNIKHLKDILNENFSHKDKKVIKRNLECAQKGFDYVQENYKEEIQPILEQRESEERVIITGNESAALGSIAGGLDFAAIYPMTPTSNILHVLAEHQQEDNYVYKQPEDEISGINMAIGAAFAGARSMVATSGGGFCLMSEAYGLAGLTETPVVMIEGMRGSPATGIPTWTEQGDLRFVLHAHQGDFPRIVLTPGDVEEVFHMTMKAFNLAEKYQTPVVVLIDKYLCESHMSIEPFEYENYEVDRGKLITEKVENYNRYELSEDGISPRAIPGTGNHFLANSDEHDEHGYSEESAENRNAQMQKRMQKLQTCADEDMEEPKLYGPENADVTLVSWGSCKGPIREALKHLDNTNYLHLNWINPFPADRVKEVLENSNYLINIEGNFSGQMKGYIREKTGIDILDSMEKYDGRPFYPKEIIDKVKSVT